MNSNEGSKPNDWRKDGLNSARYKIVRKSEKVGYLHLMIDVSTTRLASLKIDLIGSNTISTGVDYETTRFAERIECNFIQVNGYLPQNNSLMNLTYAELDEAEKGCRSEKAWSKFTY